MTSPVDVITMKRDGLELSAEAIRDFVSGYVAGRIPDYQMSAWLMAVFFRGMSRAETVALVHAMIGSGDVISLSDIPGIKTDKHSTGGVGDKASLVIGTAAAACGVAVPMMAGRGLGHTGGTLDKLEAIPGFRVNLTEAEFHEGIRADGLAIMGQTERIVPADRLMYALRDVTGTVSSLPLITASILSKKKAEGTDALIMDVKIGKGAFLPTREATLDLARELVLLGNDLGIRTKAMITGMDQPLGRAVGNWLEIRESIDALRGEGPADLMELCAAIGSEMILLGGKASSITQARQMYDDAIRSGEAFKRFVRLVERQGGDPAVIHDPGRYLGKLQPRTVYSPQSGFVSVCNALDVGRLAVRLGAGRMKKEDSIDPEAGIWFEKKIGDHVEKGEPLARVWTRIDGWKSVEEELIGCYEFSNRPVTRKPIIEGVVDEKGEFVVYGVD